MMPISVFLSRPTSIAKQFEARYVTFQAYLSRKGFRIHRLGADKYILDAPLKSVMDLMKTCRTAIILGYPQYEVRSTPSKAATPEQEISSVFPTPWNQIEATLAFKQRIPVLVIAHDGVFDYGVTGGVRAYRKPKHEGFVQKEGFPRSFSGVAEKEKVRTHIRRTEQWRRREYSSVSTMTTTWI